MTSYVDDNYTNNPSRTFVARGTMDSNNKACPNVGLVREIIWKDEGVHTASPDVPKSFGNDVWLHA